MPPTCGWKPLLDETGGFLCRCVFYDVCDYSGKFFSFFFFSRMLFLLSNLTFFAYHMGLFVHRLAAFNLLIHRFFFFVNPPADGVKKKLELATLPRIFTHAFVSI